jgi:hypothetical protein
MPFCPKNEAAEQELVMDANERLKIEQECRDLVTKLNHYHDHRCADEAAALFAEDGCWIRRERPTRGAELLASFKRGGTRVNRHVGAATLITVLDEDHAEGVTYYLALHHDPGTPDAKLPLPFEPPTTMGEWHDKFVRTPQGWRFAQRETRRVFANGAE